jgi:ABC-type glutathione transport system ATPase component
MIRSDAALGRSGELLETDTPPPHARGETQGAALTDFPSPHPAVVAEGLVKIYGNRRAVDAIDICMPDGVCFGFLGPKGAGKTTTMRMLYGRLRRDSGRLEVLGLDPDRSRR